jgi:hypothetical protein
MPERDDDEGLSAEVEAYQAKELQHFLKSEAAQNAFARTEARIVRQWLVADNPLAREMCWHKIQAFRDLQTELRAFGDRKITIA